jgi:hypothetical protein
MTLQDWLRRGWLIEHHTSPEELLTCSVWLIETLTTARCLV